MWMVEESATVDGEGIYSFVSAYPTDDDNWNAARVKVSGGDLDSPIFLNLYAGEGEVYEGDLGVELWDNGSGYWGTGLCQSPMEQEFAMECLFAIELGHNVYDASTDAIVWTTLAQSDEFTREVLSNYFYERFDLNPPSNKVWSPLEFHTMSVPEPDAGTCLLLGTAMLLLLRPKPSRE